MLKKRLSVIVASLFAFTLFLGTCEIGVRILEAMPHAHEPASDRPKRYYLRETSRTLRDLADKPKDQGVFRISVVGDSISFAPHMQSSDAFPKKLEGFLNLNELDKTKVEVLNFGTPGYSTEKEIPLVGKAIDQNSDLIILQICLNDPEKDPLRTALTEPYRPPEKLAVLFHYLHFLTFVSQRLHNVYSNRAYHQYFFDLFNKAENWERFTRAVLKIRQMAESRNIKLVPVVFPLFGDSLDDSYPFTDLHKKIEGFMLSNGLEYLDLFQTFKYQDVHRLIVIPGEDLHPNEIAHRMAAEAILKYLHEKRLVPSQFFPKHTAPKRKDVIAQHSFDSEI